MSPRKGPPCVGCRRGQATAPCRPAPLPEQRQFGDVTAGESPGLHNDFRLSEKLYRGGVPIGEAGYRSLQGLGIKTIISVDGAPPDLVLARKFSMRYVQLPFGYDGCPTPTANAIVKVVRDLPGPVYIHCHHGKHRSPTRRLSPASPSTASPTPRPSVNSNGRGRARTTRASTQTCAAAGLRPRRISIACR